MTTARSCLKTSGTVSVNKDLFWVFLDIFSVHCMFSCGKGVVTVLGERNV